METNDMQAPQSNKVRYKINIEIVAPLRVKNNIDVTMTAEELFQCIGKYTFKYGPPVNMSESDSNVVLMNFYKKDNIGLYEINLTYSKMEVGVTDNSSSSSNTRGYPKHSYNQPPPAPVESIVHPGPIKTLLDAGLITPVNDYSQHWKRNY
jgi:hypothetical protein